MDKLYLNIRNRREELGMTQKELAEKMGYTNRSSIAKVESGEVDISQSKIIQFAKVLETTPSKLMGIVKHEDSQEEKKKVETITLSEDDRELVDGVKHLTPKDKEYVSELIRRLGEPQ